MQPRTWMTERREHLQLSVKKLADLCEVPEYTIRMLEEDDRYVTHPLIVKRLKRVLKFSAAQAELMLPKCRRPHDPEYNPDAYVESFDWDTRLRLNGRV